MSTTSNSALLTYESFFYLFNAFEYEIYCLLDEIFPNRTK